MRVSLVPAYDQCSSPNGTHGAPLAFPSCNPPALTSQYLTVGTPDANGKRTTMEASILLKTVVGNPFTPADEADVKDQRRAQQRLQPGPHRLHRRSRGAIAASRSPIGATHPARAGQARRPCSRFRFRSRSDAPRTRTPDRIRLRASTTARCARPRSDHARPIARYGRSEGRRSTTAVPTATRPPPTTRSSPPKGCSFPSGRRPRPATASRTRR